MPSVFIAGTRSVLLTANRSGSRNREIRHRGSICDPIVAMIARRGLLSRPCLSAKQQHDAFTTCFVTWPHVEPRPGIIDETSLQFENLAFEFRGFDALLL